MNERQFTNLTCLKANSLTSELLSCVISTSKKLYFHEFCVKSSLIIGYSCKSIEILYGQLILMPYIYNLLLLHIMNLNGVVGAAYPRVLNYYREE
jgi:hypothetical protein